MEPYVFYKEPKPAFLCASCQPRGVSALSAPAATQPTHSWAGGVSDSGTDFSMDVSNSGTKFILSPFEMNFLKNLTKHYVEGCQRPTIDGVMMFTPDGIAKYDAHWTRDFTYMLQFAYELMPQDLIIPAINLTLSGQRRDGAMPDRVDENNVPLYGPGAPWSPLTDHAIDNGPFAAIMCATHYDRTKDAALFCAWEPQLRKGLNFVPRHQGLVFNDPKSPNCTYGFTDVIRKTGRLLFSSLLYFDATVKLAAIAEETGCGNAGQYSKEATHVLKGVDALWDEKTGMYWAASHDCKQHDVWGSLFAVALGVADAKKTKRIVAFVQADQTFLFQHGQLRHLPDRELWESCFGGCPAPGTYQQGAFWATPLAWALPVLAHHNLTFAQEQLLKVTTHFISEDNANECINEDLGYLGAANYVVSAAAVNFAARYVEAYIEEKALSILPRGN